MKPLVWVGRSREALKSFPADVQDVIGYALELAQDGGKHQSAKPLRGFHGAGVLEVVEDFDGDTYRAVYTVRFTETVYVLHCFQKKSKHGQATPKKEMDMVRRCLAAVEQRARAGQGTANRAE